MKVMQDVIVLFVEETTTTTSPLEFDDIDDDIDDEIGLFKAKVVVDVEEGVSKPEGAVTTMGGEG